MRNAVPLLFIKERCSLSAMRVLKDDKYNSILLSARTEFIAKGYKDASMRDIARQADVGLSNIYNYFRNKDEIYLAIVSPVRDRIFTFITEQHTEESIDRNRMAPMGHNEEAIEEYIGMIDRYRDEFRLLLFHSQGSSMEDFRNELTDHITIISHQYMVFEKNHFPQAGTVSDFFIHVQASWMVSILGEIVTHDMSKQKIRAFFREYFRYGFAGWRELTGT